MSRNETLKLIAFYAVLISIVCLVVIFLIQDVNERSVHPDPSLSPLGIPEKNGLSIVSHGVEITTENETALIELIEQFVQENYDNWYAMGYINKRDAAQHGVAIEIHYNPARELICPPLYEEFRPNATVMIDRIYVTIPDMPNKRNQLYYYVSPIRDGDLDHTIILPVEKANEILVLIGEDPIPPWIQIKDKLLS
ncbi:hypothetical protein [Methanorbis rubei]|uniref:Uncharacterized protein n=1 Tax=Methanorbis rubei TaxID=3028300 RepID=A0AAE4MG42_9EURY|nr:hypothetical protein [Methanocorpusculaceae archaeon Cs1]